MKKIEKDMYVRTHCGIKKISKIDEKKTVWKYFYKINDDNEYFALSDNDIVDANFDILPLIKEDDYVNGEKVLHINCKLEYDDEDSETGVNEIVYGLELETGWIYFDYEINSVLTKEQFEKYQFINKEDV